MSQGISAASRSCKGEGVGSDLELPERNVALPTHYLFSPLKSISWISEVQSCKIKMRNLCCFKPLSWRNLFWQRQEVDIGVTGLWTVTGTKIISSNENGVSKTYFYWESVGLQSRLLQVLCLIQSHLFKVGFDNHAAFSDLIPFRRVTVFSESDNLIVGASF